jgi:hypothetical protein
MKEGLRKLQYEEFHNLVLFANYNMNDQAMRDEIGRICSTNWWERQKNIDLSGKTVLK